MIPLFALLMTGPAMALDAVCTLPWLGEITRELAPEAHVIVLARGNEDPHYLSPTPALMTQVSEADLYIENGMNLELWSTRLLDGAGNPDIRPGRPGHVFASANVHRLQVPTNLTRAAGDLHPDGNPHIWLDPLNLPIAADNIAAGLARVDPANAAAYTQRAAEFHAAIDEKLFGEDLVGFMGGDLLERLARSGKLRDFLRSKGMEDRLGGWMAQAAPLEGQPVVFYHQSWAYFVDRFGLDVVGYIEDRPGIPPSAAHRDALADTMRERGVQVIGVTSYYDDRLARALAADVGARVEIIPGDVGGTAEAQDLDSLYSTLITAFAR